MYSYLYLGTNDKLFKLYTQATSKYRIQLELETPLGKALIDDNSYSGEYAYMDSSYSLLSYIRVALLSKSITMYKAFLNQPFCDV